VLELKLPDKSYLKNLRPLGRLYASRNPLERWVFLERLRVCLDMIEPNAKGTVLDIGTGSGVLLKTLEQLGTAIGLDTQKLSQAQTTLEHEKITNAYLIEADACYLPFPDKLFDYVMCVSVLDHIPEFKTCLSEIKRVLKPGGKLIVGIENETPLMPLFVIYARLVIGWRKMPFSGKLSHVYSPAEVQRGIEEVFKPIRVKKEPSFFPKWLSFYSGTLYEKRLMRHEEAV